MKLIIYFFFLLPTFLIAQNNLFFNQAKFVTLSTNTPVVVPDGKVWNLKGVSGELVTNTSCFIKVDDVEMSLSAMNSLTTLQSIWFSAGNEIKRGAQSGDRRSPEVINVLEYDVIPISTNTGTSESTGFSSSGLEFNQVINISGTANSNYSGITTTDAVGIIDTFTVPDGKVWKVESAYGVNRDGPNDSFILAQSTGNIHTVGSLFKVNNTSTSGDAQFQDDVDKQITLWVSGNINGGEETGQNTPIWLSSGTYKYQVHYSSNSSRRINAHLSAVEFNVIQ